MEKEIGRHPPSIRGLDDTISPRSFHIGSYTPPYIALDLDEMGSHFYPILINSYRSVFLTGVPWSPKNVRRISLLHLLKNIANDFALSQQPFTIWQ